MKSRIGKLVTIKVTKESYKAYVPTPLPPKPPVDLASLSNLLEKSASALAELNNMTNNIPNISLFVYMYVRKEALLSSQIEGTQSSFSDLILFENKLKPKVSLDDVEEVSNYVKAIHFALKRLDDGFPLSLRLLKDTHSILLSGSRGSNMNLGEFRSTQNWIGGTRPGNAIFVPPPVDSLNGCLDNFEKFLHDDSLPVLIKAGLCHVQFETIHPFLDGNGRLGRLLITLLLVDGGLLDKPVLYLSLFLKQNRKTYYDLLQEVRNNGSWETWLEFFLEGILTSSNQAVCTANEIIRLFDTDYAKIMTLGRARFSCKKVFEHLKHLPQTSVINLAKALDMSPPTARNCLNKMVTLDILEEITGRDRDKQYVYKRYLNVLESGAEPL